MSFQKCPNCDGFGSTGIGFPTGEPCRVCGGQGIISEQTGQPPQTITWTDNKTQKGINDYKRTD